MAEAIRETLREADIACRLDDGTFAVILEDTPENGAVWTVESRSAATWSAGSATTPCGPASPATRPTPSAPRNCWTRPEPRWTRRRSGSRTASRWPCPSERLRPTRSSAGGGERPQRAAGTPIRRSGGEF
ncbi:MAG: GGDEF domain-containing protein [Desulfomicrobium escambiense]|nr:GGDEF domain-containing protein [Desulfomicrobium escambiense]